MPDIWPAATRNGFSRCSTKLGFPLFAPELLPKDETGEWAILAGLSEFQQHMGGELTITMLREIGRGFEVHEMSKPGVGKAIDELRETLLEMKRTAVLNVVGLTAPLLERMPKSARVRGELPRHFHHPGVSGRHLHRAIDLPHRPHAGGARNRRQRMVRSRTGGSPILETIQPARPRPETVGGAAGNNARLHLRETFLVVQHVFDRRLLDHAATDVSRRRTEILRCLHRAVQHPARDQKRSGRVSFPQFLGTGGRHRVIALDRRIGEVDRRTASPDPDPDLSAAS